MTIISKAIHRINATLINITITFQKKTRTNNFIMCMGTQIPQIAKSCKGRTEMEELHYWTSDYTTKIQ